LLLQRLDALVAALSRRADEHRRTPMIGRSHGMHAEPTTFGVALAGHLAETKRGRARLRAARAEIAVGKIAGPSPRRGGRRRCGRSPRRAAPGRASPWRSCAAR